MALFLGDFVFFPMYDLLFFFTEKIWALSNNTDRPKTNRRETHIHD